MRPLTLCLLCGIASPLAAQETVPLDVAAVVRGGQWSAGGRSGDYRVVVRTGGHEHVASSILLEWLAYDPDNGEPSLAAVDSLAAIPDRFYSLGDPEFVAGAQGFTLSVCGTHTYEFSRRCWSFILGSPGQVSPVPLRQ